VKRLALLKDVIYRHHKEFNKHDEFDTLLVWHFAWRLAFPVKANRVWLDLGKGVLLPEESSLEKLGRYDKIFCKNAFHRSTLPDIPDDKIVVIPNGLDTEFQHLGRNFKNPNKIIYASNYSRGLEYMLEFGWPLIKQKMPSAELHVFYGWPKGPSREWHQKMQHLMRQPGVFEHGKVSRERLMEEKSTSIIHYYGCTFDEIDCNTVRESAFVGCVPATTNHGGLKDKDYCVKVTGNPFQPETQIALAQKIVDLLQDLSEIENLRHQFESAVQLETWDKIANRWLAEI
jgi:glycosyltransferase involved in cell wall biosynthesis